MEYNSPQFVSEQKFAPFDASSISSLPNNLGFGTSPHNLHTYNPFTQEKPSAYGLMPGSSPTPSTFKTNKTLTNMPELTIEDLREKMKSDGKGVKKNIDFEKQEVVFKSSLIDSTFKPELDVNKDLVYSISSLGGESGLKSHILLSEKIGKYESRISPNKYESQFSPYKSELNKSPILKSLSPMRPDLEESHLTDISRLSFPRNPFSPTNLLKSHSKVNPQFASSAMPSESTKVGSQMSEIASLKFGLEKPSLHTGSFPSSHFQNDVLKSTVSPGSGSKQETNKLVSSSKQVAKASRQIDEELNYKLEEYHRRLKEIEEDYYQAKESPYKISINSLIPLTLRDGYDSISSNKENASNNQERIKFPIEAVQEASKEDISYEILPEDKKRKTEQDFNLFKGVPGLEERPSRTVPADFNEGFKIAKLKYFDMHLTDEQKILNNPFKIMKMRFEARFEGNSKKAFESFSLQIQN